MLIFSSKELSPKVQTTIAIKHDGILRSAKASCGKNLGFIEVKPYRNSNHNTRGALADRLKVVETMAATLRDYNTPGVVVGGIICNGMRTCESNLVRLLMSDVAGMTFNILRGADLGNGRYAFKESLLDVSVDRILHVVTCCWRMKLALEASYATIVGTLPDDVFE